MKTRQGLRYYLHSSIHSVVIFYLAVASMILLGVVLNRVFDQMYVSMDGLWMATMIFLFVVGLNCFKTEFGLFLQVGASRRTQIVSFALLALIFAFGMSLVDTFYSWALDLNGFHSITLYRSLYLRGEGSNLSLAGFLFGGLVNLFFLCLGFLVTVLYYRMNKGFKIAVSVGVPGFLFVGLPILDAAFPRLLLVNRLIQGYIELMGLHGAFGMGVSAPWRGFLTLLIGSALLLGLSWLLMRRATLKSA